MTILFVLTAMSLFQTTTKSYADSNINISQGKSVTASGFSGVFKPELAVDGVTSARSRWAVNTENNDQKTLQVDLGANYTISYMVVKGMGAVDNAWANRNLDSYDVLLSTDGTQWWTMGSVTNNRSNENTATAPQGTQARFVKLVINQGNAENNRWASIVEFSVFGSLPPDIQLSYQSQEINNGETAINTTLGTDFGKTEVGLGEVSRTYTIKNEGLGNLLLPPISVFIDPVWVTEFEVIQPPSTVLLPGATMEFTIKYKPTGAGVCEARVLIASNDLTKPVYAFAIKGEAYIPPVITIAPYDQAPTNLDVTISASCDKGTLNANSHTFTENGSFEFIATDSDGMQAKKVVNVDFIDKKNPILTISTFDGVTPTNQDIVVTATTNEGVLNKTSYTFMENGSFEFIATDLAGNQTKEAVTITNIDKIAPVITLSNYDAITPTNQSITVTATTDEGKLNQDSFIFDLNGQFTFFAVDAAGNRTEENVIIANIDKQVPTITFLPYNSMPTNQDVIVTAVLDELGTMKEDRHTFTENGSFEFIGTDLAGNEAKQTVTITNIDKVAPIITILPYDTNPTNQPVLVTVETNEGQLVVDHYEFLDNGSFTFSATDAVGNVTTKVVTITHIDLIAPEIVIAPFGVSPTYDSIIVKAATNEGTLNQSSHTFYSNGTFEFIATDAAGNITKEVITISNILSRPSAPQTPVSTVATEDILDDDTPLSAPLFRLEPYIFGYSDGTFRPTNLISRAEIAAIFNRVLILETLDETISFKDLLNTHWAFNSIQNLVRNGLLKGYLDQTIRPSQTITRAELATMISRFVTKNQMVYEPKSNPFTDVVSHWSKPYVDVIYSMNIVFDSNKILFQPDKLVTRADAVYVINQFIKMPLKEGTQESNFLDVEADFWAVDQIEAATE